MTHFSPRTITNNDSLWEKAGNKYKTKTKTKLETLLFVISNKLGGLCVEVAHERISVRCVNQHSCCWFPDHTLPFFCSRVLALRWLLLPQQRGALPGVFIAFELQPQTHDTLLSYTVVFSFMQTLTRMLFFISTKLLHIFENSQSDHLGSSRDKRPSLGLENDTIWIIWPIKWFVGRKLFV